MLERIMTGGYQECLDGRRRIRGSLVCKDVTIIEMSNAALQERVGSYRYNILYRGFVEFTVVAIYS
jgi:hypothetical protein